MRSFVSISLLLTMGMFCPVFAQGPEDPSAPKDQQQKPKYVPKDKIKSAEHKVSNDRIDKILALLQKYYDERKNLEDSAVISDIKRDIQAFVPVVPAKKADTRPLIDIKNSLKGKIDQKFSDLDRLKKEAEVKAAKKYPMAKQNEDVQVFFRRGRTTYSMKGRFYGYGLGGKSIRLNSRTVPVFDLTPESKAMFDKKINETLRKAFVDKEIGDYQRQKLIYSEKLFAEEYAKIRKNNEKLGYIFHNGNWITAEAVLKQNLPEKIRLQKERAEKERLEREAKEKARREAGGADGEKKADGNNEDDAE